MEQLEQESRHAKRHGIHYTPPELAGFLARSTLRFATQERSGSPIRILDPACGQAALLQAVVEQTASVESRRFELIGFERDADAAETARQQTEPLRVRSSTIHCGNFLDQDEDDPAYDIVIANPPYVRTQVLGSSRAQALARQYDLTGRVDLAHVFAIAMAHSLRDGGTMGLLTSNRFLTTLAGQGVRRFLLRNFRLQAIYDLGDSRMFDAAVLPVVLIATKSGQGHSDNPCVFVRTYQQRNGNGDNATKFESLLNAIESDEYYGVAETPEGRFEVERGQLSADADGGPWSLANDENSRWLAQVAMHRQCTIGDVAHVRVGIKTTADRIFVKEHDEWGLLERSIRPETALLQPLITHHDARRWRMEARPRKAVLYPHLCHDGKRVPIQLAQFPRAMRYLESHAERLKARDYVRRSRREWFEIWVPHHPDDWRQPKIVFRDIAEQPTFFLDRTGAIVNGDCYWITLKPGVDRRWLSVILAVANSEFTTKFYDVSFHNKLYAGRRRFMTQYVKKFPLPHLESPVVQQILELTQQLTKSPDSRTEQRVAQLVNDAFGIR